MKQIKRIVVHEKYEGGVYPINDIALLILNRPFIRTSTFGPERITDVAPVDNESCSVGKYIQEPKSISIKFTIWFIIL